MTQPDPTSPFVVEPIRLPMLPAAVARRLSQAGCRWTGLSELDALYRDLPRQPDTQSFLRQVMDLLRFEVGVAPQELQRIPLQGPVVVVANHPFGGLEGVILGDLLLRQRADSKLMVNSLLLRVQELRPLFIGVNAYGGAQARRENLGRMRDALNWLKDGHLLGVFPAGEVAHWQPGQRRVADPSWHAHVAALIRHSQATVVPVHIRGRNSLAFQTLGLLHPRVRTAMLARELINKRQSRVELRVGQALPWDYLQGLGDDAAITDYLRLHTDLLAGTGPVPPLRRRRPQVGRYSQPLAAAENPLRLRAEIKALDDEHRLLRSGDFSVVCAGAGQFPTVVRELGRLREQAFRLEGEGTGRASDTDLYDSYYQHLVLWDDAAGRIAGAYRLCRSDEVVSRFGLKGLYTHSLFRFPPRLLRRIGPAIELGRSFVSPDYQRSYASLMLLWKGIARFVIEQGDCRTLFGPVTLSSEYQPYSQKLLIEFLRRHAGEAELGRLVRPRRPVRRSRDWLSAAMDRDLFIGDFDRVSRLISDIEPDEKGVPILLRHYLKLGGRILGFNIDPDFNNAIDGLIYVDLLQTPQRVLNRYMGADAAEVFVQRHQREAGLAARAG